MEKALISPSIQNSANQNTRQNRIALIEYYIYLHRIVRYKTIIMRKENNILITFSINAKI